VCLVTAPLEGSDLTHTKDPNVEEVPGEVHAKPLLRKTRRVYILVAGLPSSLSSLNQVLACGLLVLSIVQVLELLDDVQDHLFLPA
jgi:hypothetical protein